MSGPPEALAVARVSVWRADPVQMVRDLFGVEPDAWQAEALRAFADPAQRHIGLQACAGPGKSAVLAWMGWNFLLCYADRDQHPNAAAVSITGDNLKNNLWKELAVWRGRSDLLTKLFEMTTEKIFFRAHPQTWFLSARSFPKAADAETQGRTLSGLHSTFILYLLDEVGDMPANVLRSAEQGLGNCKWGKICVAFNPTSTSGIGYMVATKLREQWTLIRITADPDDADRTPRVSAEWAQEQIDLYGRDNPWVMSFILGLFPPSSLQSLLGPNDVALAQERYRSLLKRPSDFEWSQKRIGVDVARFGDDRTVLFPRQGIAAFAPIVLRHQDSVQIANRVMLGVNKWIEQGVKDVVSYVDTSGGWGKGTYDNLKAQGYDCRDVLFEDRRTTDPRFYNRRAEMLWGMSDWIKSRGCLPPGLPAEIVAELTEPTYTFREGKLLCEPKELIKKRLGRSPDLADALALTFAQPDMPASMDRSIRDRSRSARAESEWNPLEERSGAAVMV